MAYKTGGWRLETLLPEVSGEGEGMRIENNCFGNGELYDLNDLFGKTYLACAACLSVYADALSVTMRYPLCFTGNPDEAENIIVFGCQVTDLAIYNDFRSIEGFMASYPEKTYFMAGCVAKRFDIPMPGNVLRMELLAEDYREIVTRELVQWAHPFWLQSMENDSDVYSTKQGNLFRNQYPLRIGTGCNGKCTYCTIRHLRPHSKLMDYGKLVAEAKKHQHEGIVLVSDAPEYQQIVDWTEIAKNHGIQISLRNVEPQIVVMAENEILELASLGYLKQFHSPIQAINPDVLNHMGRSVPHVFRLIEIVKSLRKFGVKCATNIIVDYMDYPNDFKQVYAAFDYVSWNPYWDGKWNGMEASEVRFNQYIRDGKFNNGELQ